jgi:hypothetical protein
MQGIVDLPQVVQAAMVEFGDLFPVSRIGGISGNI